MIEDRNYRIYMGGKNLVPFRIVVKETDLYILGERDLSSKARDYVLYLRNQIETYILKYPRFKDTLVPFSDDPFAPPIVKLMIQSTKPFSVGPMASVAGAIAELLGKYLVQYSSNLVIENGGDLFIARSIKDIPISVRLHSGIKKIDENLKLAINIDLTSFGICSSSATIGHSLSFGKANLVVVLSPSPAFADGAATALCNRIKLASDIEPSINWLSTHPQIKGILIIYKDKIGIWGAMELISI